MKFTVIIATRNRTDLLPRSLNAIAAQSYGDIELIVIDDSTTEETRAGNRALLERTCPGAMYLPMPEDQRGRGPGFPRNHGIARATGDYIGFLDDDDEWIDPENLSVVATILERHGFDVHVTDQEAMQADGRVFPPPIWTEDLGTKLSAAGLKPVEGSYLVPVDKALLSNGFAHLNTMVVRRELLQETLKGFDLRITYEEDREIYYRLLDRAESIGYTPRLVARHHVPAGTKRASASNNVADEEKDASRLRWQDHLIATARLEPVRARVREERLYTLKRMALREVQKGDLVAARRFGTEALRSAFGYKWALYMGWIWARSLVAPGKATPAG